MNDIKLSLTVAVPGTVLVSEEESSVKTQEEVVQVYNPVTKKMEKVKIKLAPRKEAKQHINMCKEAYENFISNSTPIGFKGTSFEWKKLKKTEKLIWHLCEIADSLQGKIVSYHIFDD